MLPHLLEKSAGTPRGTVFWAVLSTLVAGQLVAFWMLCSQQVRKAEVRQATGQVQRMAVADCLRYVPKATLNSCADRIAPKAEPPNNLVLAADTRRPSKGGATSHMSVGVPVSFVLR